MTPHHKDILDFVFDQIGKNPSDEMLVEYASACETASITLFSVIKNDNTRERAIAELNEMTADCIRRTAQVLDGIEHGELEAREKPKAN